MTSEDNPPVKKGKIINGEFELTDSGSRKVFSTGAQRDAGDGRGFFHLVPFIAIERLAKLYEAGAVKYGANNWKKGIPLSCYINSMMRHAYKLSETWKDEDHAAAVMWNGAGFIWTLNEIKEGRLPEELDDLGWLTHD